MVEYECFRCGYNTTHRNSMKNHLNRKRICKATEDNVSIESIKEYYGFEITLKSLQNHSKSLQNTPNENCSITPNHSIFTPNHSIFTPNNSILPSNDKNISNICNFCNRTYSRKDNLTKHLKICKKKRELDKEKEIRNSK